MCHLESLDNFGCFVRVESNLNFIRFSLDCLVSGVRISVFGGFWFASLLCLLRLLGF